MFYYFLLFYMLLFDIVLSCIISCYIILYCIILYYLMLYYIILYFLILYYISLYHSILHSILFILFYSSIIFIFIHNFKISDLLPKLKEAKHTVDLLNRVTMAFDVVLEKGAEQIPKVKISVINSEPKLSILIDPQEFLPKLR